MTKSKTPKWDAAAETGDPIRMCAVGQQLELSEARLLKALEKCVEALQARTEFRANLVAKRALAAAEAAIEGARR